MATAWLMVLLTIGTIVQKDIGLHQAQMRYFSSWVVWSGFIPLPGGLTTMGLVYIGLLTKLIFKTPLTLKNSGIAITHLGSFLLLTGGLLTGLFSVEGNMVIQEGQSVSHFTDYHKRELALIDTSPKDFDLTTTFADGFLRPGQHIKHPNLPFEIDVLHYCENCQILPLKEADDFSGSTRIGFAQRFQLAPTKLAKEDSENRSGMEFIVKNATSGNGRYLIVEGMPIDQTLQIGGKKYIVELRRKQYELPFQIHLLDFEKKTHAATSMAKSFKSVVRLKEGDLDQRTVIQMNEPLRYKGYTLYQASFIEGLQSETTVLAVVKNVGRLFPYISSIIICIGILIHLLLNSAALFHRD